MSDENKNTKNKEFVKVSNNTLSSREKKEIENSVAKTVNEYGETLRLLGDE